MSIRCVALLSGGLDSILAIRIMQEQGIEVEALNFKTIFTCCQDQSAQAARELDVKLTVVGQEDDYLELIRKPRFGYGKGANPCVDCRIYMFERARRFMRECDAQFVISGEVVGQRPKSQKKRDLNVISHHSNLEDLLLRPLSARCLPETLPERMGWVDRERLFGFVGRSRKGLIALAQQYGMKDIPSPSTGCALTEPRFSRKVFDLVQIETEPGHWDFELLKHGRHFRIDRDTKVVIGRRESENHHLEYLHSLPDAKSSAVIMPDNFAGPLGLLVGPLEESSRDFAAGLVLRHSNDIRASDDRNTPQVRITTRSDAYRIVPRVTPQVEQAVTLTLS